MYDVLVGDLKERLHLLYVGVDGKIIFKMWDEEEWTDLAQYRDRWRALVNAVMNLRVP